MEGRESTEAFDFAFGPMEEYLGDLRTLTPKGKPFGVFSFRPWKSQLRLIEGCYSGQTGAVSGLLTVGAPDEISPLFAFKTVGIPRSFFWTVRNCSESGNVIVRRRCIIILSFFFSSTASAISGMLSLRRVLTAVQFGDMRPGMGSCDRLAANVMGFIWGALLAMQPNDRELVPPSAGRFGFTCLFSEGKKSSVLIRRVPDPKGVQIQTPALETILRCACLDVHLQLTLCCFA